MRRCRWCGYVGPDRDFSKATAKLVSFRCKACANKRMREYMASSATQRRRKQEAGLLWQRANPKRGMVLRARERAAKAGVPCTITADDFSIPERCPLLGILLKRASGSGKFQP